MFNRFLAVFILSLIFLLSCSNGNGLVTSPPADPGITGASKISDAASSHFLLGYYDILIDPDNLTVEPVPLRTTEFTANVLRLMQPPATPVNLISVSIIDISQIAQGYIEVDFNIIHPIPGNPIFRTFDLRGIIISNGTQATAHDPEVIYASADETRLLNADGYTRWGNAQEFTSYDILFGYTKGVLGFDVYPTATLNGYKYYASAFDYDEPVWTLDPSTRGSFEVGSGVLSRPMFIQFRMDGDTPDFTFNYAIDTSWDLPDPGGAPEYPPDSYPLTANMNEAYCVSVLQTESTAWWESPNIYGGEINMDIRVYDWQAMGNPEGVPGEINGIWIESPMLMAPLDVLPTATVLPDGPTSSVYQVTLGNLSLTHSGDEELLVTVEASDEFGYQPQVANGDQFDFPSGPLGSYFLTSVYIMDEPVMQHSPVVISIDPNTGQSGDQLVDVLVEGMFFQSGAQVELRSLENGTVEFDNEIMGGAGTQITSDLDLTLVHDGIYDVAVINPDLEDGILENGFIVDCADGIHDYDAKYLLTDGISWIKNCQKGDIAILETGNYAGQCVMKRDRDVIGDYTGYYILFDPDNPSDAPVTEYFTLPGSHDGSEFYVGMTAAIDQNPANAHLGVVNGRMFDTVQIIDEDGNLIDSVVVETTPDAYPGKYSVIPAIDFDRDGDLWLVTDLRGEYPGQPQEILDPVWQLRHYELQESAPYYVENLADRLELNSDLTVTYPYGTDVCDLVADIAISYSEDCMILYAWSTWGEIFVKYDISQSPPMWVMEADLYPGSGSVCSHPYSGATRMDIDFDHTDLSVENCRLMVMYQTWDGEVHVHLMRLDTDLNVLNDMIVGPSYGSWDNPHCFAVNTDPDIRNIIMVDMEGAGSDYNDFFYYPMPAEGW